MRYYSCLAGLAAQCGLDFQDIERYQSAFDLPGGDTSAATNPYDYGGGPVGKKKDKEPQEVVLNWAGDHEQRHAILYTGLFQVAAQLTQICHPNGGKPEEVVETFTKIYALLHEWYKGTSFKTEIKRMLEILLPDGPGGGDGNTANATEIQVARLMNLYTQQEVRDEGHRAQD